LNERLGDDKIVAEELGLSSRSGRGRARHAREAGRRLSSPGYMRRSSRLTAPGSAVGPDLPRPEPEKVSEQLERWLRTRGHKTLGSLIELFEEKGFAILFVLLLVVGRRSRCRPAAPHTVRDHRRAARP
jgi:hypothetical protein